MNAPGPPPTIPYRTFLVNGISRSESLKLTILDGVHRSSMATVVVCSTSEAICAEGPS
jgi:hypothetical protein